MIIRTITCHDVYNLGASLQAYALQYYLKSKGHDMRIIDYKPDYLSRHFKFNIIANPKFDKPVIRQLYLIAKFPGRLLELKRKKKFDSFTHKYLKLTRRYDSYESLKADPPVADCYIAGSDQIWNTIFQNGRDSAFYLDFGSPEVKRISYAASFATSTVAVEYRDFVSNKLSRLDAISIREKSSLSLLVELGRKDGVAVCDPVFLINKAEWNKLVVQECGNSVKKEKYLLVYLTDRSLQIEKIASTVKEKTGWKIYSVGGLKAHCSDKSYRNAGPLDFVNLIKNAEFVISNSFHATAFAIIMGTKFCVVNREDAINERMKSILEDYDLSNRLVSEFNDTLLNDIDINELDACRIRLTNASKEWLTAQLEK